MPLSPYCIRVVHPDSPGHVVLFSTRTAAIAGLSLDLLHDIERDDLSPDERESLATLGFLAASVEEEQQEMRSYIDRMNAMSKMIKLIVVMNLDCNLACAYCFEGTRKGKYFLSIETASDLLRFVTARINGKKEIFITFYGGEPLLSMDMIGRISEQMMSLAAARGIKYGFSLITNGTLLTRRNIDRLKPLGLSFASVTLDGPRETHDLSRPFKSGVGSFDTIIANLQDIRGQIDIKIGGNFTRTNYRQFPGLLDVLVDSDLGPDSIASISFDPVYNETADISPDFHGGCSTINEPWLVEAGIFLRQEILTRGFCTEAVQPSVCMLERVNHFVVNWDGGLYKCPGLIGRTKYQAGTLKSGELDYGPVHNLGNWKNEECLACCYLPLCFGGCRYMTLLREGNMQGIDCKKRYFDRALGPLVLQDVRYEKSMTP